MYVCRNPAVASPRDFHAAARCGKEPDQNQADSVFGPYGLPLFRFTGGMLITLGSLGMLDYFGPVTKNRPRGQALALSTNCS